MGNELFVLIHDANENNVMIGACSVINEQEFGLCRNLREEIQTYEVDWKHSHCNYISTIYRKKTVPRERISADKEK